MITIYHIYLNIIYSDEHSFEKSIKLLLGEFYGRPYIFSLLSIFFICISYLVSIQINRIWSIIEDKYLNNKAKNQQNIERTKRGIDNKDSFLEKVFRKFDSISEYPLNPIYRIKGEYSEVNVRNINDNRSSPHQDYMYKFEVFNYTDEGVEVLGGENLSGFKLLIDENDNWGVLDRYDKQCKGVFKQPEIAYSVYLIHYEDILYVDWNHDPVDGRKHPFKEFRYYIDTGILGIRQLEPNSRKRLSKFDMRKYFRIYSDRIKQDRFNRKIKQQKQLWR